MRNTVRKRLEALEQSLPPAPIRFLLPDEWQALIRKHDGNKARAVRDLGSEPVLVPDEATRTTADGMFNDPHNPNLKFTCVPVWDRILEANNGCPAVLRTTPFVLCADWMTFETLAGKNPLINRFGCGLTEEEQRGLEEEAAAEDTRRACE